MLDSLADDGPPTQRPEPGPQRGRWSDVPAAARGAAATLEMAVVRSEETDGQWIFHLRSVGDVPAELRVMRRTGDEIYAATATAGLFGNRDDLAEDLLRAFDKRMRARSRKPKFPETSD